MADRKDDTRRKIQLGGLVVKAGLEGEDAAFILGVLVDSYTKKDVPSYRSQMVLKGSAAFGDKQV